MRTELVDGLPADWKALKSCVPRRCWAASCMAATSKRLQGARLSDQEEVASQVGLATPHPTHCHTHPHSLCPKCPASVSFKHRQLVRPGAACDQAVQVGPGCSRVSGMEVTGHTEGLQDPVGVRLDTPQK